MSKNGGAVVNAKGLKSENGVKGRGAKPADAGDAEPQAGESVSRLAALERLVEQGERRRDEKKIQEEQERTYIEGVCALRTIKETEAVIPAKWNHAVMVYPKKSMRFSGDSEFRNYTGTQVSEAVELLRKGFCVSFGCNSQEAPQLALLLQREAAFPLNAVYDELDSEQVYLIRAEEKGVNRAG